MDIEITLLAPIVLFVYNRPEHTRKAIESLQQNDLAGDSDLFIYSDAAKNELAGPAVQQVREYLKTISGFKSVTVVERSRNWGLARSIIDGASTLSSQFGRVIVLEDDLVTSRHFLRFMNEALTLYADDDRVISIHGYVSPVKGPLPETFFLRGADCWGWATWQRGWNEFQPDSAQLLAELTRRKLTGTFDYDGAYPHTNMLKMQMTGRVDSWAIRWHASAFLKDKLTLYPGKSLVANIGNDSSGTHCGATDMFSGEISSDRLHVGDIAVQESQVGRAAMRDFYSAHKISLFRRIVRKLGTLYRKSVISLGFAG
ncbi:glycosyltransferase family 2 protein [Herbaspirillum lusitanum]|uniref:glycosyltransferase family 2 protein n=1 Tax=Herbaspirillum lusitanum TaxID=213312 RepID=UPI000369AA1E|nr:glycosyltransferase [Herbaspirillum lusitanum]